MFNYGARSSAFSDQNCLRASQYDNDNPYAVYTAGAGTQETNAGHSMMDELTEATGFSKYQSNNTKYPQYNISFNNTEDNDNTTAASTGFSRRQQQQQRDDQAETGERIIEEEGQMEIVFNREELIGGSSGTSRATPASAAASSGRKSGSRGASKAGSGHKNMGLSDKTRRALRIPPPSFLHSVGLTSVSPFSVASRTQDSGSVKSNSSSARRRRVSRIPAYKKPEQPTHSVDLLMNRRSHISQNPRRTNKYAAALASLDAGADGDTEAGSSPGFDVTSNEASYRGLPQHFVSQSPSLQQQLPHGISQQSIYSSDSSWNVQDEMRLQELTQGLSDHPAGTLPCVSPPVATKRQLPLPPAQQVQNVFSDLTYEEDPLVVHHHSRMKAISATPPPQPAADTVSTTSHSITKHARLAKIRNSRYLQGHHSTAGSGSGRHSTAGSAAGAGRNSARGTPNDPGKRTPSTPVRKHSRDMNLTPSTPVGSRHGSRHGTPYGSRALAQPRRQQQEQQTTPAISNRYAVRGTPSTPSHGSSARQQPQQQRQPTPSTPVSAKTLLQLYTGNNSKPTNNYGQLSVPPSPTPRERKLVQPKKLSQLRREKEEELANQQEALKRKQDANKLSHKVSDRLSYLSRAYIERRRGTDTSVASTRQDAMKSPTGSHKRNHSLGSVGSISRQTSSSVLRGAMTIMKKRRESVQSKESKDNTPTNTSAKLQSTPSRRGCRVQMEDAVSAEGLEVIRVPTMSTYMTDIPASNTAGDDSKDLEVAAANANESVAPSCVSSVGFSPPPQIIRELLDDGYGEGPVSVSGTTVTENRIPAYAMFERAVQTKRHTGHIAHDSFALSGSRPSAFVPVAGALHSRERNASEEYGVRNGEEGRPDQPYDLVSPMTLQTDQLSAIRGQVMSSDDDDCIVLESFPEPDQDDQSRFFRVNRKQHIQALENIRIDIEQISTAQTHTTAGWSSKHRDVPNTSYGDNFFQRSKIDSRNSDQGPNKSGVKVVSKKDQRKSLLPRADVTRQTELQRLKDTLRKIVKMEPRIQQEVDLGDLLDADVHAQEEITQVLSGLAEMPEEDLTQVLSGLGEEQSIKVESGIQQKDPDGVIASAINDITSRILRLQEAGGKRDPEEQRKSIKRSVSHGQEPEGQTSLPPNRILKGLETTKMLLSPTGTPKNIFKQPQTPQPLKSSKRSILKALASVKAAKSNKEQATPTSSSSSSGASDTSSRDGTSQLRPIVIPDVQQDLSTLLPTKSNDLFHSLGSVYTSARGRGINGAEEEILFTTEDVEGKDNRDTPADPPQNGTRINSSTMPSPRRRKEAIAGSMDAKVIGKDKKGAYPFLGIADVVTPATRNVSQVAPLQTKHQSIDFANQVLINSEDKGAIIASSVPAGFSSSDSCEEDVPSVIFAVDEIEEAVQERRLEISEHPRHYSKKKEKDRKMEQALLQLKTKKISAANYRVIMLGLRKLNIVEDNVSEGHGASSIDKSLFKKEHVSSTEFDKVIQALAKVRVVDEALEPVRPFGEEDARESLEVIHCETMDSTACIKGIRNNHVRSDDTEAAIGGTQLGEYKSHRNTRARAMGVQPMKSINIPLEDRYDYMLAKNKDLESESQDSDLEEPGQSVEIADLDSLVVCAESQAQPRARDPPTDKSISLPTVSCDLNIKKIPKEKMEIADLNSIIVCVGSHTQASVKEEEDTCGNMGERCMRDPPTDKSVHSPPTTPILSSYQSTRIAPTWQKKDPPPKDISSKQANNLKHSDSSVASASILRSTSTASSVLIRPPAIPERQREPSIASSIFPKRRAAYDRKQLHYQLSSLSVETLKSTPSMAKKAASELAHITQSLKALQNLKTHEMMADRSMEEDEKTDKLCTQDSESLDTTGPEKATSEAIIHDILPAEKETHKMIESDGVRCKPSPPSSSSSSSSSSSKSSTGKLRDEFRKMIENDIGELTADNSIRPELQHNESLEETANIQSNNQTADESKSNSPMQQERPLTDTESDDSQDGSKAENIDRQTPDNSTEQNSFRAQHWDDQSTTKGTNDSTSAGVEEICTVIYDDGTEEVIPWSGDDGIEIILSHATDSYLTSIDEDSLAEPSDKESQSSLKLQVLTQQPIPQPKTPAKRVSPKLIIETEPSPSNKASTRPCDQLVGMVLSVRNDDSTNASTSLLEKRSKSDNTNSSSFDFVDFKLNQEKPAKGSSNLDSDYPETPGSSHFNKACSETTDSVRNMPSSLQGSSRAPPNPTHREKPSRTRVPPSNCKAKVDLFKRRLETASKYSIVGNDIVSSSNASKASSTLSSHGQPRHSRDLSLDESKFGDFTTSTPSGTKTAPSKPRLKNDKDSSRASSPGSTDCSTLIGDKYIDVDIDQDRLKEKIKVVKADIENVRQRLQRKAPKASGKGSPEQSPRKSDAQRKEVERPFDSRSNVISPDSTQDWTVDDNQKIIEVGTDSFSLPTCFEPKKSNRRERMMETRRRLAAEEAAAAIAARLGAVLKSGSGRDSATDDSATATGVSTKESSLGGSRADTILRDEFDIVQVAERAERKVRAGLAKMKKGLAENKRTRTPSTEQFRKIAHHNASPKKKYSESPKVKTKQFTPAPAASSILESLNLFSWMGKLAGGK